MAMDSASHASDHSSIPSVSITFDKILSLIQIKHIQVE